MKNEPIKQHYVPKMLLKHFAIDEVSNKEIRVWVTDLKDNNKFLSAIRDIAFEKHIYTLEKDDKIHNAYTFENAFNKIETSADKILLKIINERKLPPKRTDDYKMLIHFFTLLKVRNPVMINKSEKFWTLANNVSKFLEKKGQLDITYEKLFELYKDDESLGGGVERNGIVFSILDMIDVLQPFFYDRNWVLISNDVVVSRHSELGGFICSDYPVILQDRKHFNQPMIGVGYKEVDILIPISSKLCVLGTYEKMKEYNEVSIKGLCQINRDIYKSTQRFIFSSKEKSVYLENEKCTYK